MADGVQKNGIYIDIGANNPDVINNTKLFYEKGWRGINIEPSEKEFRMLQEKRPVFYKGEKDNSGNTFNKEVAKKGG